MTLIGLLERIAEANKMMFGQHGKRRLTPGSLHEFSSRLQLPYVSVANSLHDEGDGWLENNCS
ncbi:MAG TPA: hypothetical protein VFC74_06335 [Oscillospiraceae bacterium]|nr:hypothetical protein [Oscillospiraceae bacterium]